MEYEYTNCVFQIISPENKDIRNCYVYNMANAIEASTYPMKSSIDDATPRAALEVAKNLAKTIRGGGEDNFLSGILVSMDLTLPNKVWVEMERYHFLQIVSSQSTMHRMGRFDLSSGELFNEYVDPRVIDIVDDLQKQYQRNPNPENYLKLLNSNPAGFKLTAHIVTNYRQLRTIYHQRKNHRLPEWREFCKFLETLPYAEYFIMV